MGQKKGPESGEVVVVVVGMVSHAYVSQTWATRDAHAKTEGSKVVYDTSTSNTKITSNEAAHGINGGEPGTLKTQVSWSRFQLLTLTLTLTQPRRIQTRQQKANMSMMTACLNPGKTNHRTNISTTTSKAPWG